MSEWDEPDRDGAVEAAGIRWQVRVAGRGPAVLLLHGSGASAHSWAGLGPLLESRFTVVAPDLPGHGGTRPLPASGCRSPASPPGSRSC
jgi:magnesium chelatase accessory protein